MDTQERILARALELFNRNGIEYVGMRELAASLGIRLGNITYYFPTKDHLVAQLSERYSASNSLIHSANPVTGLYDLLKKDELLYHNALRYRALMLSMVHLMEQNKLISRNYKAVANMRMKGLRSDIQTLADNRFLDIGSPDEIWFLVSANSLINRFWMGEAVLLSKRSQIDAQAAHYLKLLAFLFKPYASKKGKSDIDMFLSELK